MRVGIFGGTFNPIHYGHLRSAEEVCETFSLDRVYFVPSARPPHKAEEDIAPAEDRFKMVELAIADNPSFVASSVELEREGLSYSVDTIRYFLTTFQPSSLAFIVGIDAFRELHSWREYEQIPALCDIIVTSRPGETNPSMQQPLPVALKSAFWYDSSIRRYQHISGHSLSLYTITGLLISSSTIREIIHQERSIRYLVPSTVEAYINRHSLYRIK